MTNTFLILFFLIVFFGFLYSLFFYSKRNKRSANKRIIRDDSNHFLKREECNPDINTDNWDLHKFRLGKFRRSQYKGLTFFISAENRIYYFSEKGAKVYC